MTTVLIQIILALGCAQLASYLVSRWSAYRSARQKLSSLPCLTFPFAPYKIPGLLLATSWWNPGGLYPWFFRGSLYKGNDSRTTAVVSFFNDTIVIFSASLEVNRQVTAPRSAWDRGLGFARVENIPRHAFNVATAQMDNYPRHRRIVTPAFNQNLYRQVWEESILAYQGMYNGEGWSNVDRISVSNLQLLTSKVTLGIIAQVGFGTSLPWSTPSGSLPVDLSMRDALQITADEAILRSALPEWAYGLPFQRLRRIKLAHDSLMSFMKKRIELRRSSKQMEDEADNGDVFGFLLNANASESSEQSLSDDEVLSNIFILLFAGHETSSKALCATLGLLACHPAEQDRLWTAIIKVLPEKAKPTFEDYASLKPVLDCVLESLRLFPIAPILKREAMEDTTLHVPGVANPVFLPKGTDFVCDITGLNYDPERWVNPEQFLPSRWSAKMEFKTDDYISFGLGLHACLGRTFALYEMVCFLTMLLRVWKVEPTLQTGETRQEWRKRVLEKRVSLGLTFGPTSIPITLVRR